MKLKEEYQDKIVKVNTGSGLVTFDTSKTPESDYKAFHALGFDFCFEPEEPTYKKPISYLGVETTKVYKNKNAKKAKTESEKD